MRSAAGAPTIRPSPSASRIVRSDFEGVAAGLSPLVRQRFYYALSKTVSRIRRR